MYKTETNYFRKFVEKTKRFFNFHSIERSTKTLLLLLKLNNFIFQVTVRAKDGGRQNALQSTCKVYVTVTDVNDNKPSFTNDNITYYATILRNDVLLNIQVRISQVKLKIYFVCRSKVFFGKRVLLIVLVIYFIYDEAK